MLPSRTAVASFSAFILLLWAAGVQATKDVPDPFLTEFAPPDARVFGSARFGLEQYRDSRQFKNEWSIRVDEQKGVIETNWFPEHKGEVELKVQIVVWGDSFRVDAWQKVGWIFSSVEKTDRSRRTERHIQDLIRKRLSGGSL